MHIDIEKKNESLKNEAKKKLKILKKAFFSSSLIAQMKNTINYQYFTSHYTNRITYEKIHNVITKSSSYKASSSSSILNSILQLLMHEITSILLSLFNKCYDTEYCSKAFKNSITIILRKSKNIDSKKKSRDYQKSKSYRSIALFKTLKKALKSIIIRKITYIAEKHTLLFENHMKERRCKSTKHVVHALIEFIIISWNKNKIMSKLFMNVTKAFNNMIHVKLLHNLKKKSVNHRAIRWIENFLKARKTIIKINEASTNNIEIEISTSQKFSLLSILYLFYNANLIKTAKKYKCMLFTNFIDDVMFAMTEKSSTINNEILVKAHEKTLKWAKLHEFKFFIKKYQLIHYSWKKNNEHKFDLQLENQIIKIKLHSKFLKVIMNNKLLWKKHVNKLKKRAMKSITKLSKLTESTWKNCFLSIRRLYEVIIISQIIYCCSMWYTSSKKKITKNECWKIFEIYKLKLWKW